MASVELWIETLSLIKALFEAVTLGEEIYQHKGTEPAADPQESRRVIIYSAQQKYKRDPETRQEARNVSSAYSTFSEEEVTSMLERLKRCQQRFIEQGGGKERVMCICSVLEEVKEGNGGTLPNIDDWRNIYNTLCKSKP